MFEIGPALRQARDRRRLGLDQAEAETKVRARYLRALEEEDFDLLPGPTYVKGFLRTYADYLGLDGRLFVEEYTCRFVDPRHEDELLFPRRRPLPAARRRSRRERDVILVALVSITAIAVLVLMGSRFSDDAASTQAPPPLPASASTGPKAIVNPLMQGATQNAAKAAATAVRPAKKRRPVRLVAKATGLCWVMIWEGRNRLARPVFTATLDPADADAGVVGPLRSSRGFTVQVGAPGNLGLVVNGVPQVLGGGRFFYVAPDGKVAPA